MPNRIPSRFTVQPVDLLDIAQKVGEKKDKEVAVVVQREEKCNHVAVTIPDKDPAANYAKMHKRTHFEVIVLVAVLIVFIIVLGNVAF